MYINISEFISNKYELIFERHGSCNIDGIQSEINFTDDLDYYLLISKVDKELIINLWIGYEYSKQCDRCLQEVINDDYVDYTGKLLNNTDYSDDLMFDSDIVIMNQNSFNLYELINELVILSIPMKNLCSEECLGLCPVCGIDLNKGKCDCELESGDLRFSVLKDFKIDEEV